MAPAHVFFALPLACLAIMSCGNFSARPDPSRFYTLAPLPQAEESAGIDSGAGGQISLGVGPVSFPGYLDRDQIVTRVAQNRFDLSENDRWAEPLEENFTRVLSQNLSALLRTDRIIRYPWSIARQPAYQLELQVLRFEPDAAQDVQLFARWTVIDVGNKKPLAIRESRLTRPVKAKSTEASVAALSEALGDLSQAIADAVKAAGGK